MANEKHLAILKGGIQTWNQWRDKHPEIRPDLSEANLGKANLSQANLSQANLWKADLHEADLRATNLQQADIGDAHLFKAYLRGANLQGANLRRAYLFHANLFGADLSGANLSQASLVGTNLFDANLSRSDLSSTHLSRAYLNRANLSKASLNSAHLNEANLSEANLSGARLSRCQALATNFTQAILTGACLDSWEIDSNTNFTRVTCDYVYLQRNRRQRCPHSGCFDPGEFAQRFQPSSDTFDLVFSHGINWEAFLQAFQSLQQTVGSANLSIQAFENHPTAGSWIVRIQTAIAADRDAMQQSLEQDYRATLKTLKEHLHNLPPASSPPALFPPTNNLNLLGLAQLAARRTMAQIPADSPTEPTTHQAIPATVSLPPKPTYKELPTRLSSHRNLPAHPPSQDTASPQSLPEIARPTPKPSDAVRSENLLSQSAVSSQSLSEIARPTPKPSDAAIVVENLPSQGTASPQPLPEIARPVSKPSGKEDLTAQKHIAFSEKLSQAHIVALLMKVRHTVALAKLPEPVKTGVIAYLKIAQQAMERKPLQRKTAQSALNNITEILAISSKTWQSGKDLWKQVHVILKIAKDWLSAEKVERG